MAPYCHPDHCHLTPEMGGIDKLIDIGIISRGINSGIHSDIRGVYSGMLSTQNVI